MLFIILAQTFAVQYGLIATVCNNNPALTDGCLGDFALSFYFVLSTLSTTGYGNFSPKSSFFLLYNMPVFPLFSNVCEILLNMIMELIDNCIHCCRCPWPCIWCVRGNFDQIDDPIAIHQVELAQIDIWCMHIHIHENAAQHMHVQINHEHVRDRLIRDRIILIIKFDSLTIQTVTPSSARRLGSRPTRPKWRPPCPWPRRHHWHVRQPHWQILSEL